MKTLIISFMISLFIPLPAMAQIIDLREICQNPEEQELIVLDNGFCHEYLKQQNEIQLNGEESNQPDKWKVRFYMSHSFTNYFQTDITFQSTRYNIEIKDYKWAERSSREYFLPRVLMEEGNNPFNWVDEPTNTFTLSLEKDGNEFFLQLFHPKFLQADNQEKYMVGTIDGVNVDGIAPINRPFDGYNQSPGESEIMGNQNTRHQMTFEAGYGRRFNLLNEKFGSINYIPSLSVGVMTGNNSSLVIQENEWWEYEGNREPYGIQGIGGSFTNRVEFNTPNDRVGIFYENKLSGYHQKHAFLDGTQEYNLGFMGHNIGVNVMIFNPLNHSKPNLKF